MDITELILYDHHEQRRMFAMLEEIDPSDQQALGSIWERLRVLLEVHAKAEEELFYPRLAKLQRDLVAKESPQAETEDAIHDHNEIRDAIAGLDGHGLGSAEWLKAVEKVNEVNSDHMAEEERQGLTDFRRHIDRDERHRMAVAFAAYEAQHAARGVPMRDQDAERYVDEHS